MSSMSEAQKEQAISLLAALQENGHLQSLLAEVSTRSQSGGYGGAMNDSSKRRLTATGSDEASESPTNSEGGAKFVMVQMPEPPAGAGGKASKIDLPSGVDSMEEWPRTVCELPKVAAMKKTYAQLQADAEKGDQDVKNYLVFVLGYNGSSERTKDFAAYLRAVGYNQSKSYFSNGQARKFG